MPTSGTIAQTQVSVDTLVSHALTRAGKLPSTAGGELLQRIREALYFILADLGNDGINLWCLTKSVVNVVPNQTSYSLPLGTNDITTALYRQLFTIPGAVTLSASAVTDVLTSADVVTNITGTFMAGGTASLAIEYSIDGGTTWVTLTTLQTIVVQTGAVFVIDLDNSALASQWRIRDIDGALPAMTNVLFRKTNQEVTMAKLNRDDYMNLPNKQYVGQKSLQYWFDKQIEPRVWVWPVSSQSVDQLIFWQASQIQDPGDLTNDLAVPTRWYQAISDVLSYRTAMLIPPNELPAGRLDTLKLDSDASTVNASNGESDGSSYHLAPRISGYTR